MGAPATEIKQVSDLKGQRIKSVDWEEASHLKLTFVSGAKLSVYGCGCCGSPSVVELENN